MNTKKRQNACIILIVCLVSMLAAAIILSTQAQAGLPGARSYYNSSNGDVYLGGNYIQFGIAANGSSGKVTTAVSTANASLSTGTTTFYSRQSNSYFAFFGDADGFGSGKDLRIDYFLPGTPAEGWGVGYNAGAGNITAYNNHTTTNISGYAFTNNTSGSTLQTTGTGTYNSALRVQQVISFDVNSKAVKNEITLTNDTGSAMNSVRFVRSFDPDNTVDAGGGYSTINTVVRQGDGSGNAIVEAKSQAGDAYATLAGSQATIQYFSADTRARVFQNVNILTSPSTILNPYNATYDSPPATNATTTDDTGMAIWFEQTNLAAGASTTFTYYTVMRATGGVVSTGPSYDYTFSSNDFQFQPPNVDLGTVTVKTTPGTGTLYLDADTDGTVDGGETAALNQNILTASLTQLKFKPAGGATENSNYDSFTFQVNDDATQTYTMTVGIVINVPDAPTIGSATAGNAQASVAFTAPADNGGSPITSYTATSSPGGLTGTGSSSPITVTGLTNGTSYTFTVTATNSKGTGASSSASNSVTPTAPPSSDDPPPKVTLTVSSTSPSSGATGVGTSTAVSATFSMYMNGSTLTTDTFKLQSDGGAVTGSVTTNGATATFTPSSNLAYNTTYTATITTGAQAANAAGTTLDSSYSWSFTTESAPVVTPTPTPSPTGAAIATPMHSPTPVATATATSTPTPTPSVSPTPAAVSASLSLSKEKAYLSGDTIAVTVVDADRDANVASEDTLTTAIKVTALGYYAGGDLVLDMKENGANSGTFLATIKTGTTTIGGASSSTRSNIGTIKTVQGGTATVIYTDTTPTASTITKTLSFSSSDATLAFDAESYIVGSYAVVTHVDAEVNTDNTQEDTLLNHVVIETSSINRAWMRLAETGADTGTFKGSILVSSDATIDNERIQASNGDTLSAGCTDEINTSGAPRQVTAVSRVVSLETTPTPATTPSPTPVITATPTPEVCIAEKITLSSYRLKVIKNQRAEVTVTVTGKKDCSVEGAKVRVLYLVTNPNDSGHISVSRRSAVTDADGRAVFTIKAGNKTGMADLTFKTGSLKGARLVVKIVSKKGK